MVSTHAVEAVVAASAQHALALVEHVETGAKFRSASLKEIRVGGGFLSNDLATRVQSRLCRNLVVEYDATEAGLIAFANYDMIADVPNAVGFLVPGVSIEIVDETNRPLPAGVEGLLRCRTSYFSTVFAANYPDRAHEADDLWWYPGDVGHVTQAGILCIAGRADDAKKRWLSEATAD